MRYALIAVLLLAGCKSDGAKLQQLKDRVQAAQKDSALWEERFRNTFPSGDLQKTGTMLDSVKAANNRLDLARRDLNRFLK